MENSLKIIVIISLFLFVGDTFPWRICPYPGQTLVYRKILGLTQRAPGRLLHAHEAA